MKSVLKFYAFLIIINIFLKKKLTYQNTIKYPKMHHEKTKF